MINTAPALRSLRMEYNAKGRWQHRAHVSNARYFAHRGEVEHGHLQLERDAVSYISDNYDPLVASGQMTLLDTPSGGHTKIVPGVSVEVFPGHTAQMMAVMLDSGGSRACYISDLMPTSAHLM